MSIASDDMTDDVKNLLSGFERINELREAAGKRPYAKSTLGMYAVGDAIFLSRLERNARIHPDIMRRAKAWIKTESAKFTGTKRRGGAK